MFVLADAAATSPGDANSPEVMNVGVMKS